MEESRNWVVIADRNGQLGNRLIVFSHFMAHSMEKGYGILNPYFQEYEAYFSRSINGTAATDRYRTHFFTSPLLNRLAASLLAKTTGLLLRTLPDSSLYRIVRIYQTHDRSSSPGEYYDLRSDHFSSAVKRKYVLMQGWKFRSFPDVEKHGDAIRDYFSLTAPYKNRVDAHMRKIRGEQEVVVGLHIRRGDYKAFENGRYYFSIEAYSNLLRKLLDGVFAGKKVCFMICSNEPVSMDDFEGLPVQSGPGHFIEDLYALAQCDYIIGPPSTYSHWAAFYGKKPLAKMRSIDAGVSLEDFRIPLSL